MLKTTKQLLIVTSLVTGAAVAHWDWHLGIGTVATGKPASAPTSFAAVEHNANVDLTWDSVSAATFYDVDFRLSTDTIWTDDSEGADTSENVASLTNDVMYDFRVAGCNSAGCGPYSQLDDITPAVLADLIRSFSESNSNDRIFIPKRIDTMWEDTARTDQVDVTGDKILHADDLSTNGLAQGWIQATATDEPDWDSDDGSYWNGDTNTDVHMDFDAAPSFTGEFLVCMAVTMNNSNNFFKYLRDGTANALRRQSSDGSSWRLIGTTNDVTFSTTPSKGGDASTYPWNIICFDRNASNTLTGYLQRIGTNPDSPTDSTWANVGSVASVTGNWEPDVMGAESGSGAPEGHIAGLMMRATDFDDDTERDAIFEDLLDLIKL